MSIQNNVFSNNAVGVTVAATGPITFEVDAGHTVSNSPGSAADAVNLVGLGGNDIFANVSGTLSGARNALEADTSGDIRINFFGTATSTSSDAIEPKPAVRSGSSHPGTSTPTATPSSCRRTGPKASR